MKKFYRWLHKKITQATEEAEIDELWDTGSISGSPKQYHFDTPSSIRFTIYKATGGYVLEYISRTRGAANTYDDDSVSNLYLIPEDADIGKEISKIVTFELLMK